MGQKPPEEFGSQRKPMGQEPPKVEAGEVAGRAPVEFGGGQAG